VAEPVLSVTDLAVSFPAEQGRVTAVRELSYQVSASEVLGVVGESGSGKSVSSLAVMGLLPPQATVTGSIRFQGRELLGCPDAELSQIRGRHISMIFQDPLSALTPVYTVGEQVAEALLVHGAPSRRVASARAVKLLDLVGIPDAARRAQAFPHEFSGGMRQRVVIAMAIANDPDLIIADEPTTALDVTVQAQVLAVLATARELTGAAIILITHDLGVVAGFADRVQVMHAGHAVETGPVEDIFYHPRMPYTQGLLAAIPRLDAVTPPVNGKQCHSRAVLRVDGLVRHYPVRKGTILRRRVGTVRAVDGISFELRERETLGLVGESGCGKTSTLMEILHLAAPAQGRIEVLGTDVSTLDRRQRKQLRRDIQVVFQDPVASLDPRLPVFDVLAEPLSAHGVAAAEIRRQVPELLRLVGLDPEHASRYPAEFSGGQRQRIGIARALALEPKVLVLDEPVSALDVSIQAGVLNLLAELQARLGLAMLFVAHDLAVVRQVADRVAVMYLGTIVEIGPVDAVYTAPQHPYTQALLSAVPIPDPRKERARERILLSGDLPSPADVPSGCRFRTRCFRYAALPPELQARCEQEEPARQQRGAAEHESACHYAMAQAVL
jgi:peptide/nickel transport system ATP-binding protein